MHEVLYPLAQGYEFGRARECDVEMSGTGSKKFNLLVGRELQKDYNQPQQIVGDHAFAGRSGWRRRRCRSRSATISVLPSQLRVMFRKIMSISDSLMFRYYELLAPTPA